MQAQSNPSCDAFLHAVVVMEKFLGGGHVGRSVHCKVSTLINILNVRVQF